LQPNQPALSGGFVFLDLSAEKPIVAADKIAEELTADVALVGLLSSAVVIAAAMEG
jgi:hypothetical protein